jgi:hypothetical protein
LRKRREHAQNIATMDAGGDAPISLHFVRATIDEIGDQR